MYKRNLETRSLYHCCREKAHILSVYLALVTQNAMRMRLIEFSFVTCPVVLYFSTSHKRQDFHKKNY